MHIALTAAQEALRAELRDYFADLVTGGARGPRERDRRVRRRRGLPRVIRQLGPDGWLGIGWPKEYGGQDRSMVDQLIFTDAAAVAGVPIPYLTLNTVGPTIMRYGTPAQKDHFLPRILTGDLHFSIGYSEPDSGTDLASLAHPRRARRRRVGHQRPEDVDHPGPVRRLDLARLPHRPRPAPPQGALDDPRPGRRPRLLLHPGAHGGRCRHHRHLLRGRAGARVEPRRRAQRRLAADDQPAQPRAGGADLLGAAEALDRPGARWAQETKTPTARA